MLCLKIVLDLHMRLELINTILQTAPSTTLGYASPKQFRNLVGSIGNDPISQAFQASANPSQLTTHILTNVQ